MNPGSLSSQVIFTSISALYNTDCVKNQFNSENILYNLATLRTHCFCTDEAKTPANMQVGVQPSLGYFAQIKV